MKINNCFWENSDMNYLRNPQPSASFFRQEKLKNNNTISQSGILPEKQTLAELVFPVGIPIRNQSEFLSRPLWLQAFWVAIIFTCMYQVPGAWQANAARVRACAHDFFWHNKLAQIATKKQLHCGINPSSISSKWASTENFRLLFQVRKINLTYIMYVHMGNH